MAKWLAGAQSIPNERGVEDASWRRQHLRRALIQKYWHDLDKREKDGLLTVRTIGAKPTRMESMRCVWGRAGHSVWLRGD